MAVKEFDQEDPFDLVGAPVPNEEGHDNIEEMTRCVIEEYMSMGWSGKVILRMFKTPTYTGPHTVYKARGEEYVLRMIDEAKERHVAFMQRILGKSVEQEV